MKTLTELADAYGSDKGLSYKEGHGYTLLYEDLFAPYKNKPISFLELGLLIVAEDAGAPFNSKRGQSPSVKMWQDFFGDSAKITGFDCSDFSFQQNERFKFMMGDSGSDEDMIKLSKLNNPYDIIVEDASHNSYHQQNAIKFLWDSLSPNGLFVIEDLHWQQEGFPVPLQVKTFDLFNEFFNNDNYIHSDVLSIDMMKKIKDESQYILLHKSCTSIGQCLIIKKNK